MELTYDTFKSIGYAGGIPISILIAIWVLSTLAFSTQKPPNGRPLLNDRRWYELGYIFAKARFLNNGRHLLQQGFAQASVFDIITENTRMTVFDPKYAEELRKIGALNVHKALAEDARVGVAGFESASDAFVDDVFIETVKRKLTPNLGHMGEPLSSETAVSLKDEFTDNHVWHELDMHKSVLKIVTQVSSKIFLGDEICRDPRWLRVVGRYAGNLMRTAIILRIWPKFAKPIVAKFVPACYRLQQDQNDAESIIMHVLKKRRLAKAAAIEQGKEPPKYMDVMEWLEETANGRPYNPVYAQIAMSVAAVHSTADLLAKLFLDLHGQERLLGELREEIKTTVGAEGCTQAALSKMKLMDSVLKESQRLNPQALVSARRFAEETVTLSDGTVIPQGTRIIISAKRQFEDAYYPDAATFDPYRFLKLRDVSGYGASAQFSSTSPEHLGFGLGKDSCPGRFFTANEIKIILSHILAKYDFKFVGQKPTIMTMGTMLFVDPSAKISVRRRREDIVL